jgi:exodeoxyribonuclease V alpha subunit
VPHFTLSKVFRQAQKSQIVRYAHQLNHGRTPHIDSPFFKPEIWQGQSDCLFIDAEEATQEELRFIQRAKRCPDLFDALPLKTKESTTISELYEFQTKEPRKSPYEADFVLPKKFQHVDFSQLREASSQAEELKAVVRKLHPWSALNYGLTASQVLEKLYLDWIPKYYGKKCEIQILSPMTKGSLGTARINELIQQKANPPARDKAEIKINEKIFAKTTMIWGFLMVISAPLPQSTVKQNPVRWNFPVTVAWLPMAKRTCTKLNMPSALPSTRARGVNLRW